MLSSTAHHPVYNLTLWKPRNHKRTLTPQISTQGIYYFERLCRARRTLPFDYTKRRIMTRRKAPVQEVGTQ